MKTTSNFYKATTIEGMCHVDIKKPEKKLSEEIRKVFTEKFVCAFPDSALGKHVKGRETAGRRPSAFAGGESSFPEPSESVKIVFEKCTNNNVFLIYISRKFPDLEL